MSAHKREIPYGFREDGMLPYVVLVKKYRCSNALIARWRRELGLPSGANRKPVDQYTLDGKFVARHKSLHEAARAVNGNFENISSCAAGKISTAYGWKWRLADANNVS